jgi:hypothetical protein
MVAFNTKVGAGWTIGPGWKMGTLEYLTTSSAQSYSSGASMATFRVLNRGGNWDEFFANWANGSWSCSQIPGSRVTNMTNPGDDSPIITITGGTFVLNNFYSFYGHV